MSYRALPRKGTVFGLHEGLGVAVTKGFKGRALGLAQNAHCCGEPERKRKKRDKPDGRGIKKPRKVGIPVTVGKEAREE